jgi:hypothetical protein
VVDLFRGTKEDQFQGKARLFGHFFGEPKKNEQIDGNRDGQSGGSLLEKRCTERP